MEPGTDVKTESCGERSRSGERSSKAPPPHPPSSAKDTKPTQSGARRADDKDKETKKKAVSIMIGKRRGGGRVLPTGVVVKKQRKVDKDKPKGKSDAWSEYMAEVGRYRDQSCTEERQNRPLVK